MTSASAEALAIPLSSLTGVGAKRAAELARVGLHTLEDLLLRFPIRYEDRRRTASIASLRPGTLATVIGDVAGSGLRRTRRPGFTIFEMTVKDGSGSLKAVWFNQRFLREVFHRGQQVALFGKVEQTAAGLQMTSPQYEILGDSSEDEDPDDVETVDGQEDSGATAVAAPGGTSGEDEETSVHHGRIVPVYERIGSLTPKIQRSLVRQALDRLPSTLFDPIPRDIRSTHRMPGRAEALRDAHFPDEGADVDALNAFRSPAQQRLIYEEFFLFQLGVALRRQSIERERKAHVPVVTDAIRDAARRVLPFQLTTGQKVALRDIVRDMEKPQPMNRLLQGDVGTGKTIVGVLASIVAMENGLQVALMAPTEILADQHLATIRRLLRDTRFRVEELTGGGKPAVRRALLTDLASGDIQFAVGTHALLQEGVAFHRLGLAIIDEQHRFGVVQRSQLREKGTPDVLVMTATPIPRTLALTTYGDLDVSVIKERPAGRQPIKTTVRPETRRDEVWQFVRGELERGRQAYVIYPLIEESEKIDVRAATAMAEHLALDVFPPFKVALLHGRLKSDEKDRIMAQFAAGEIQVLVSTTVVEVGVDVPNATVMVVEHAERFGLSQLHQLRGRVGRGLEASHCVLLYQPPLSDDARARLKAMSETNDGFELAERDLQLRGPGDFFGTRQSGLPTLRIGDLVRDFAVLQQARDEARAWLADAKKDDPILRLAWGSWRDRFGLVDVG